MGLPKAWRQKVSLQNEPCDVAVWREMVAMQRRGTNVVVGGDRQKLGAKELDVSAVVKRNRKQITAVLASLTVFAVLLSKSPACQSNSQA